MAMRGSGAVRARFGRGALYLPDHSVIVTDDDADPMWLTMASPIDEQLQVMATSFDITGDGAAAQNRFILPRSHTHTMHTAGANGKGTRSAATTTDRRRACARPVSRWRAPSSRGM